MGVEEPDGPDPETRDDSGPPVDDDASTLDDPACAPAGTRSGLDARSGLTTDDLSRAPTDLSREWVLHGCHRSVFEGKPRPSLGRTLLLAKLGAGGMGTVYFGLNPRLNAEVAVKVLDRAHLERSPGAEERFLREARLAAGLDSSHLVRVYDVDRDEVSGLHYIVMEYVHGPTARRWRRTAEGDVAEHDALTICHAAATGLAALHISGAVHRDIKPENILLPTDAGGSPQLGAAKVADLGLARLIAKGNSLTGTQSGLGTPGFMAPEQARDAKRAGKPADVFALGATLYALLTGSAPFSGSSPMDSMLQTIRGEYAPVRERRGDVSPATAAVIDRCLSVEPEERFPDASALRDALEIAISASSMRTPEARAAISRVEGLVRAPEQGKRLSESDSQISIASILRSRRPAAIAAGVLALAGLTWGAVAVLGTADESAPPADVPAPPPAPTELRLMGGVPGAVVALSGPADYRVEWRDDEPRPTATLVPGKYTLRATAWGFEDYESELAAEPGGNPLIELPFSRLAGYLDVSGAPEDVALTFAGEPLDGTVTLTAGTHRLTAARDGCWPKSLDVDVSPGATFAPSIRTPWEPVASSGSLHLTWSGDVRVDGAQLDAACSEATPIGPSARIITRDGAATVLVADPDGPARDRLTLGSNTTAERQAPRLENDIPHVRLESGSLEARVGRSTVVTAGGFHFLPLDQAKGRFSITTRESRRGELEIEVAAIDGAVTADAFFIEVVVSAGDRAKIEYHGATDALYFRAAESNTADVLVTRRTRRGTIEVLVPARATGQIATEPGVGATRVVHGEDSTALRPLRIGSHIESMGSVAGKIAVGEFADIWDGEPIEPRSLSEMGTIIKAPPTEALVRIKFVGEFENVRGDAAELASAELQFLDAASRTEIARATGSTGLLLPTGQYEVNVGSATEPVSIALSVAKEGTDLVLPRALPRDMAIVNRPGGEPAFLIDRMEVSNAQYNVFADATGRAQLSAAPDLPAVGLSIDQVREYARWAGKQLPTADQWRDAAFGTDGVQRRFPWGNEPGVIGAHFIGKQSDPGPVDSCPEGASPYGVLNMAGNAAEWLADGWVIGGSHRVGEFSVTVSTFKGDELWTADLLRDPVPTEDVFEHLDDQFVNRYDRYRIRNKASLQLVGFRCVIPLE